MRKLLWIFGGTTVFLMAVIACQKEASSPHDNKVFDEKAAKEWYYGTFKKTAEWANYNSTVNGKKLPDWKNGEYKKIGETEMVEFPLVKERKSVTITHRGNLPEADKRKIADATISRIVFIKNSTGKISVRELQYVPDVDYMASHAYDISKNSVGMFDKDFAGTIISRKWDGQEKARSILKHGKVTGRFKKALNSGPRIESCPSGNTEVIEWARDDEMHIYGDGMITYEYGEWYPTGNTWCIGNEDIEDDPGCSDPSSPECWCELIGCDEEGGGDTPPCTQQQMDDAFDNLSVEPSNEKEEIQAINVGPTSITRDYKWKFVKVETGIGTGIIFYSLESGVQEMGADGWWRWTSFVHKSTSQSGDAPFWDAEVKSLTATPTIQNIEIGGPVNTTVSIAGMQLDWGLKLTYSCGFFTGSQYPTGNSSNSWYTYEQ